MFRVRSDRQVIFSLTALICIAALFSVQGLGQSGKGTAAGRRAETLNVIVHTPDGKQLLKDEFQLYDSGMPQEILTFSKLDAGSRIVLMVDSSATLKVDTPALQKAIRAVIDELFEDDQMMVVGYSEAAEIVEEMTPDLQKLQASPTKVIRKGTPNLFDALIAVSDTLAAQAKSGLEKRAIILISDGYDSESKTKFDEALHALQKENIILYAISAPDRTRGALLRDKPKAPAVLEQLTAGTGGAIYKIDNIVEASKQIADEMRTSWYRLVYEPSGINTINLRRLLLMPNDPKVALRTKGSHPPRFR